MERELLFLFLFMFGAACSKDACVISVVESIPENLTYHGGAPMHQSIFSSWENLIHKAKHGIDIASSYWSLRGSDINVHDRSTWQGQKIFNDLVAAARTKNISIRIAENKADKRQPDKDTTDFVKMGVADVRQLDFKRLIGQGILHTKMWLVDGRHFYVGSANLDFRSLTQVKETGLVVYDCPTLAADMSKIFEVYWQMGSPGAVVPKRWPKSLSTVYNMNTPLQIQLNGSSSKTYLTSSPPQFCPEGRTTDIDGILSVIRGATTHVHIAVMDFVPLVMYSRPQKYYPVFWDALVKAAVDSRVEVKVLGSWWQHGIDEMKNFLRALSCLSGVSGAKIHVGLFTVPPLSRVDIPYSRVNHNKYMVTDSQAFLGTSNWSGDYFLYTGGVGLVINDTNGVVHQLNHLFDRDWSSNYTTIISCGKNND